MKDILEMTTEEFPAFCHAQGLKCTAQRLTVFEIVHGLRTHPSVDDVWEAARPKIRTITRESVYRILNEFAAVGLIQRMDSFAGARYDSSRKPHAHFICEMCGHVADSPMPDGFKMPAEISGIVHNVELRVTGICVSCQKKFKARG